MPSKLTLAALPELQGAATSIERLSRALAEHHWTSLEHLETSHPAPMEPQGPPSLAQAIRRLGLGALPDHL